jgi:hypothetical protein
MSKIPRWGTQNDTRFNNADNIERYLQEDGHRTWELVIYRCTYGSDSDWNKFLALLRDRIKEALECYKGLDLLEGLSLEVVEDQSVFDDASMSVVHKHFKCWAVIALGQEQGLCIGPGLSQRYRYCVLYKWTIGIKDGFRLRE